jgi:uncharacterized protein YheU (UPF0270 family)
MSSATGAPLESVEIPCAALSAGALRAVIEAFVLREGTDYGAHEFTLEEKREQVLARLQRGEARILYDPLSETVTLELVPR